MPNFSEIGSICRELPDDSRYFPAEVFKLLHEQALLQINLPEDYQNGNRQHLLYKTLFEIGKASLSVGRIYEGHINAVKLIKDHGSAGQKDFYFPEVQNGKLFSVWNTEMNSEALTAEKEKDSILLKGAKTFCSGGLYIDYALITAAINGEKQLLIIPLKDYPQLKADWSLWRPMGMKNSVSCRVDFTGLKISSENMLGDLNAYQEEPWFSGGAMRFAAVQLGGAEAVMIAALDHLKLQDRTGDPYQQQRMGTMAIQIQSGKFWLEQAQKINENPDNFTAAEIVNFANMMRSAVLKISEKMLYLAERSIGVQGFMETHPLEQVYRDLKVYLKQPGPDLALQHIGVYTFDHYKK